MKRNSLTTALLAGLAGAAGIAATANAVNVNPDGVGGALIYPYYTVNKGNSTLMSVVNTTSQVKAVKVRFLEGRNSREVLDFNLYLSPFDVWTAAIFASNPTNAASAARIRTLDTSCTVPVIPAAGQDFLPFAYDGSSAVIDHNPAQLPRYSSVERTREGYIELFDMGVVGGSQAAAATHGASGVPANCGALVANWAGGAWTTTSGTANISLPTGGLYGSASIVNVAEGVLYSYDAIALEGFYTNGNAPAALHSDPVSVIPNLGSADSGGGISRSLVVANNGQTLVIDNWAPVSVAGTTIGGWDSVSALFMHDNIYNEYLTDAALGATSEWVITFPTKRFYVDRTAPAVTPFSNVFRATSANPGSCEEVTIRNWDREEQTSVLTVNFSPPGPTVRPALCYEAQVVTFNQTLTAISPGFTSQSANLGSNYAANVNTIGAAPFTAGHSRFTFAQSSQQLSNPISGNIYRGLPVVGFWTQRVINAGAGGPGVLANYSGTWDHKYSRNITSGQPVPEPR